MKQKNKILIIVYLLIFSLFTSCLSIPSSAVSTGPRTLIINDVTVSATDTDNGFTSWYCVDYVCRLCLWRKCFSGSWLFL